MNPFVADPEWGWWIVFYFFSGGIASGAYFAATLIDLFGDRDDRELARTGYWIAFPLVCLCGVLLIADLHRPERFWHMLFKSEVVHQALDEGWPWSGGWGTMLSAPIFKFGSPMSVGSWALLLFGFCSSLSFLGSLWPARGAGPGPIGILLRIVGSAVGFFVASYTGALLTATNEPLWSDNIWIAPLFLTSAASTGLAAILLLTHCRGKLSESTKVKLGRADNLALAIELFVFVPFAASLGPLFLAQGIVGPLGLLFALAILVGTITPLLLRTGRKRELSGALAALAGGFLLRWAMVMTPPQLLAHREDLPTPEAIGTPPASAWLPKLSPEDGREPGEKGADPDNRAGEVKPRSKVFGDD